MNESNNRGEAMTELQKFRKWADDIGHWQIVAGVDRYLAMLETEEYKERKNANIQNRKHSSTADRNPG